MESKTVRSVLLMCLILHLIRGVYLLSCPSYTKQEAIDKGLLNDRASCMAMKYDYQDKICLNGMKSIDYCAFGTCDLNGHNCNGRCVTGKLLEKSNNDKNKIPSIDGDRNE